MLWKKNKITSTVTKINNPKQVIQCSILHDKDNWLHHCVTSGMVSLFKHNFYGLFEH